MSPPGQTGPADGASWSVPARAEPLPRHQEPACPTRRPPGPGQVWERKEKDGTGPDLLLILSFDQSQEGRTALCEYSDGEHDELLLDELRRHYALRCRPADDNTEPSGPCPGQH
ncbi:hypothetical protein ACFYM0_35960 [Streptomyces sp. NPDC006487]|uniref:hypothetical protein n=1 Tax=Streptomyces sp. NPDC006487 TaxID=3364748 RepID=UPI0036738279